MSFNNTFERIMRKKREKEQQAKDDALQIRHLLDIARANKPNDFHVEQTVRAHWGNQRTYNKGRLGRLRRKTS